MKDLATKQANKLNKISVPVAFYDRFLADVDRNESTLIAKLHDAEVKPRGRGHSRVIHNLTEAEWNELYDRTVDARSAIIKAERKVTFPAAICAKDLAKRMETLGVDNPRPYVPSKTRTVKPKDDTTAETEDESTSDAGEGETVQEDPITLPEADDVEEMDEVERQLAGMNIQNS